MSGGGPSLNRGGEIGCDVRTCAESRVASSGTTAHATTAVGACTGSALAVVTAWRRREASVVQQSGALPWAAHFISPSLQHAICMFGVDAAASAHSAQSDQPTAAASTNASMRIERQSLMLI